MFSSDIYVTTSSDEGINSSISADFGSSSVGCIQDKKIDIIPLNSRSSYTLFTNLTWPSHVSYLIVLIFVKKCQ